MLSAVDLTCVRGDRPLFSGLSLAICPGEVLYVSGNNGAGKTSLLRMLAGLASPENGVVCWNDKPIRSLKEEYFERLLFLGHAAALKDELSAIENLTISSKISGHSVTNEQARQALRFFGLGGREHLPARVLSAGQRRKVNLARLLLPKGPVIWVLDEPFTALDSKAVSQLTQVIEEHTASGGMVVLTTHQEVAFRAPVKRIVIEARKVAAC